VRQCTVYSNPFRLKYLDKVHTLRLRANFYMGNISSNCGIALGYAYSFSVESLEMRDGYEGDKRVTKKSWGFSNLPMARKGLMSRPPWKIPEKVLRQLYRRIYAEMKASTKLHLIVVTDSYHHKRLNLLSVAEMVDYTGKWTRGPVATNPNYVGHQVSTWTKKRHLPNPKLKEYRERNRAIARAAA